MIDPRSLKVVFMGTPDFALPTLQGLIDSGARLLAVYTQPDRPKGRGRKLAPSPVKELAVREGIPVLQPQKLRDPQVVEELRRLAPDLIVVIAYGQILPQSVLDIPHHGCINVHASLLPEYRGAAPINKAIIDGETETGITTMLMDAGLDTGDMLVKKATPVGPFETAGGLHDRLALLGREAMDETMRRLCDGTLRPEKQDDSLTCYAPMLKKEDGRIDWTRTAVEIHNQVRGLDPWPGAFTFLEGEVLKIAVTAPQDGGGDPGTVVAVDRNSVQVACGMGVLRIGELQLPGKKRLPAADFLRGCPLPVGTLLES